MTFTLQDRRVLTALRAVFLLGLLGVLLICLAALTLCSMLLNALASNVADAFSTIGTLYSHGGPLTHLVMLLGALFGIPYSFKRVRMPILRFFRRQFARFSAFAQRQQTPPANEDEETHDERDYEEGEVVDLDAAEEGKHQTRTTARQPHMTSKRTPTTANKQGKQRNKKRPRKARAALTLTHV